MIAFDQVQRTAYAGEERPLILERLSSLPRYVKDSLARRERAKKLSHLAKKEEIVVIEGTLKVAF